MRFRCIVPIFAIFIVSGFASARDLFVNNLSGNDRNSGETANNTSPGVGPTQTIQRAVSLANFGDRIIVANTGVPYREALSLQTSRNSGSITFPFVIEGNGAILDGTGPIPPGEWEAVGENVLSFSPPRLKSFQQIFLNGKPLERIELSGKDDWQRLTAMQSARWGTRLLIRVEEGKVPSDYDLRYSVERVGLTLYGIENVEIRNLVIQGFQIDGISAADNTFDCRLVNVTARGNGRSGIHVGGASRVTVDGCLVGDNAVAQLHTEGWSTTVVVNSELLDNTAPAYIMNGGRLIINGDEKRRETRQPVLDSAPLHRP